MNRRDLLKSIGAAGAIATIPTAGAAFAAMPSRAAWDAAMARLEKIRAEGKALDERLDRAAQGYADMAGQPLGEHGLPKRPLNEEAARLSGYAQTEHLWEAHSDQLADAQDALIKMPAPDAEALLWKIEHLFGPADSVWCQEYTAQFYIDARRLLATGRA